MKERLADANFPLSSTGRTYHLSCRSGELANRIITCGDPVRARRIAGYLDDKLFELSSHRGFLTITGRYRGVVVSIVAIGMGLAMMDFFVREARAVVKGEMVIVRLGSCGAIRPEIAIGDLVVPRRALGIIRNPSHWHGSPASRRDEKAYILTHAVEGDQELHDILVTALHSATTSSMVPSQSPTSLSTPISIGSHSKPQGSFPSTSSPAYTQPPTPTPSSPKLAADASQPALTATAPKVHAGLTHASADTFYASQGRTDERFPDDNQDLIETLANFKTEGESEVQGVSTLEMETAHLFDLAAISLPSRPLAAHPASEIPTSDDAAFIASRTRSLKLSDGRSVREATGLPETSTRPVSTQLDKASGGAGHADVRGKMRAAAVHIVFAGRADRSFIEPDVVAAREETAGKACLDTLAEVVIPDEYLHPEVEAVWKT